jgi:hypothetical protein
MPEENPYEPEPTRFFDRPSPSSDQQGKNNLNPLDRVNPDQSHNPAKISDSPDHPSSDYHPQNKSWHGLWITMSIIAALLLILILILIFVIRYENRSTPNKTLDAFCNALQHGDYHFAYDQFSRKLQRDMLFPETASEAAFGTVISQDKVTACTYDTSDDSGYSVTTNLRLVHASKGINNDVVMLTKDMNNNWKIDDVYQQRQT